MVNAHCHLELSYLKGKIAERCGFAGFADGIAAARDGASPEERFHAAAFRDAKMYSEGVAAVGDVCNGTSTFAMKQQSKIYYHNFIELFGLRATDYSPIAEVMQGAAAAGLEYSPTPHSTYSLADAPFREAAAAAAGAPLSVHFMESRAEAELFKGYGPLHERNVREGLSIDFARYGSPAERIIGSIPKGTKILLIHNAFATEEDVQRITSHFGNENVTWVLCPRSNEYIEEAAPPVAMLRRLGANIAVGTDSLASNDSLSVIEELKVLQALDETVPLEELFGWVTEGGARALGIGSWAGSFEAGKRPGAALITGIDWDAMRLTPAAESRHIL